MKITIFIVIGFLFLLYPTSSNGIIRDSSLNVIFDWSIVYLLLIVVSFFYTKFDIKNVIIAFSIFAYLCIVTIISNKSDFYSEFSIARVAPLCLFLLLTTMKLELKISMNKLFAIFDLAIMLIIVCNILILLKNNFIERFIIDNYSQLYKEATSNMFIMKRPVFTFGVYTFASYFYSLFFLLSFYSYNVTSKYKYIIICFVLLIFNILLASNFSMFSSLYMVFIILNSLIRNKKSREILIFIIFLFMVGIWLVNNQSLLSHYEESLFSENNGFVGRYSSSGVLNVNENYLETNYNIGFNIVRNCKLTYTDSGYLVLRLMGGWILIMPLYYLLYKFMKNNLKKNYLLFFIITLVFESALPISTYIKFVYAMFFCIIYLSSLRSYEKMIIRSTKKVYFSKKIYKSSRCMKR